MQLPSVDTVLRPTRLPTTACYHDDRDRPQAKPTTTRKVLTTMRRRRTTQRSSLRRPLWPSTTSSLSSRWRATRTDIRTIVVLIIITLVPTGSWVMLPPRGGRPNTPALGWRCRAPSQKARRPPSFTTAVRGTTLRMSGYGIAQHYTWQEEAFEIEVSVPVPVDTRPSDLAFRATSKTLSLNWTQPSQSSTTTSSSSSSSTSSSTVHQLLDPRRPLKGRIDVDATLWVLSEPLEAPFENADEHTSTTITTPATRTHRPLLLPHVRPSWMLISSPDRGDAHLTANATLERLRPYRLVTITLEKIIRTPKDDFDVVEYDWKGLYADEEPGEVVQRLYDVPEKLNVREYAAKLGVDLDHLNMSMVDKSMFSTGLNLTQAALDQLTASGLVQAAPEPPPLIFNEEDEEVEEDTEKSTRPDGLDSGTMTSKEYTQSIQQRRRNLPPIPLIDSVPTIQAGTKKNDEADNYLEEEEEDNEEYVSPTVMVDGNSTRASILSTEPRLVTVSTPDGQEQQVLQWQRNMTRAAFAQEAQKITTLKPERSMAPPTPDPIDGLTVDRLQQILRSQGLPTTGTVPELRRRLRQQVNALLQGRPGSTSSSSEERGP